MLMVDVLDRFSLYGDFFTGIKFNRNDFRVLGFIPGNIRQYRSGPVEKGRLLPIEVKWFI
jgi:hypothetical protein